MTQTAPTVQLTLESMLAKFQDKHPTLIEPFEKIRPELEEGTGTKALTDLISCEVDVKAEQGFFVYSWMGQNNPFELRVPKPFDPHPQHSGELQQQAQVQEAEPEPTPQTTRESAEPAADPPAPEEATPPAEVGPEDVKKTAKPFFWSLAQLLGESTMVMTVAITGEKNKELSLTVTVLPQGEEAFPPLCLEGTGAELDQDFFTALYSRAESKKSLAEQIEALKAADEELEEAKKQEVAAKTKQADAKKKAADKKVEQAKAEEAKAEDAKVEEVKVEEQAETEKQQEALF